MVQEVRIPVKADVAHGVAGVGKVEDAFDEAAASAAGVGKAVGDVGRKIDDTANKAKRLADAIARVSASAERLKRVQGILQTNLGGPVSEDDARTFLRNFHRMRAPGSISSPRLRKFGSVEEWDAGVGSTFRNADDEAQHRRYVMHVGMRGTKWAADNAPSPAEPPAPGGDGFGGGVQRAQNMAVAFGKGALAAAGITSIASMIGSAVDMATEEATGTDTTKRLMGDLGISFEQLRQSSRAAAHGLGLTYVEAMRLQQQFVRVAGDVHGVNVGAATHTAGDFARRFGLDPSESVQFFGTMQRLHVTNGDEQSMRRLATLIGAAIEKSGYTGKADEIVGKISDLAETAAHVSLSTPNVGVYANYMASLLGRNVPGLDPAAASGMLNAADAAIRQGGGMGDASLNFAYAALSRHSPGMNVFTAKALMEGGLGATTRSVFGPDSELGKYYAAKGMPIPKLDDVTNLQKEMEFMKMFASGNSLLTSLQNHFKLSSQAQALELMQMTDHAVSPGDWQAMAKRLDQDREHTQGDTTREDIAAMKDALTNAGSNLLGPINKIREAIEKIAGVSPDGKTGPAPGPVKKSFWGMAGQSWDDAQIIGENIRKYGREDWGAVPKGVIDEIYHTDYVLGLPPESTLRQMIKESGGKHLDPRATNAKTGAMGMAQVMPSTLKELEKRWGRKIDPYNPMDAVYLNRYLMRENLQHFHYSYADALRGYDSGWDPSKWNNAETNDYARSLMAGGGWKADPQHIRVVIEGETRIPAKDHTGKTVGHTTLKAVQKPTPAGAVGLTITSGMAGGALRAD